MLDVEDFADLLLDAFLKWIIIAPGPRTASHILPSRISCAFYSMRLLACPIWKLFSGSVHHLYGRTVICQA